MGLFNQVSTLICRWLIWQAAKLLPTCLLSEGQAHSLHWCPNRNAVYDHDQQSVENATIAIILG